MIVITLIGAFCTDFIELTCMSIDISFAMKIGIAQAFGVVCIYYHVS